MIKFEYCPILGLKWWEIIGFKQKINKRNLINTPLKSQNLNKGKNFKTQHKFKNKNNENLHWNKDH